MDDATLIILGGAIAANAVLWLAYWGLWVVVQQHPLLTTMCRTVSVVTIVVALGLSAVACDKKTGSPGRQTPEEEAAVEAYRVAEQKKRNLNALKMKCLTQVRTKMNAHQVAAVLGPDGDNINDRRWTFLVATYRWGCCCEVSFTIPEWRVWNITWNGHRSK